MRRRDSIRGSCPPPRTINFGAVRPGTDSLFRCSLGACLLGLSGCAALSPQACRDVPPLLRKVENSSGVVRTENELDLRAARVRCQLDLAGLGQREVAKTENLPAFRLDQWMMLVKTLGAGLRSRFLSASTFGP